MKRRLKYWIVVGTLLLVLVGWASIAFVELAPEPGMELLRARIASIPSASPELHAVYRSLMACPDALFLKVDADLRSWPQSPGSWERLSLPVEGTQWATEVRDRLARAWEVAHSSPHGTRFLGGDFRFSVLVEVHFLDRHSPLETDYALHGADVFVRISEQLWGPEGTRAICRLAALFAGCVESGASLERDGASVYFGRAMAYLLRRCAEQRCLPADEFREYAAVANSGFIGSLPVFEALRYIRGEAPLAEEVLWLLERRRKELRATGAPYRTETSAFESFILTLRGSRSARETADAISENLAFMYAF